MKKYIKHITILLLLLAVIKVDAQQNAVLTHYTLNPYLYNAAQVGESGYSTLSAHYRKQWVNMPDAPDTKLLSAQTMIKNKFGIGAKIYYDQVHIVKNFGALFSYAYYLRSKKNPTKHYLSIGISAGFKSQSISFENSIIKDDFDPTIFYEGASNTIFDAEAGLKYRLKGLHVGLFASNIAPQSYNYKNNNTSLEFTPAYHFYGSLGYDIILDKKRTLTLKPSVLARYIPNIPFQIDGNLLLDWKKTIWIGGGYRYDNAGLWGLAGFRIHDMVSVSYSYEQSIDGYQAPLGASHEISIEFRFKKKKDSEEIMEEVNRKISGVKNNLIEKNKELIDSIQEVENKLDDYISEAELKADLDKKAKDIDYKGATVKYVALGTVNFNLNSATIHSEQNAEAEAIYNQIKALKEKIILIRVEGNASIEGTETYNLILSNKRTIAMKDFLTKKGIDGDIIATSSKGNSEAMVRDNNYQNKSKVKPNPEDRFVKIYILYND